MSTAGIGERGEGRADVGRIERRQVALHVDHDLRGSPLDRSAPRPRRCGRNRRHGRPGSSPAAPPALLTAAAISAESVATNTGPTRGGDRPVHHMGDHRASGDVGERLAGKPGRRHPGRDQNDDACRHGRGVSTAHKIRRKFKFRGRLYGLPRRRQTGYLCAAAGAGQTAHFPRDRWRWTPLNSTRSPVPSWRPACSSWRSTRRRGDLRPAEAGQARLRDRDPEGGRRRRGRQARAGGAVRKAPGQRHGRARPERRPRSARPAIPSIRAARTRSVPTCGASSDGRAPPRPGSTIRQAMKAKGGDWTIDDLNKFLENPKGFVPGTAMTFGGFPRGTQRADVIDYLNSPLRQSEAASGRQAVDVRRNEVGAAVSRHPKLGLRQSCTSRIDPDRDQRRRALSILTER